MTTKRKSIEELVRLQRKEYAARAAAKRPAKLWPFTDEEEQRMRHAVRASIRFMANFGQAPQQPLIDTTHYYNDKQINWHGRN